MDLKISSQTIYGESLSLLTDLYQLSMVYGYWKAKIAHRRAVFHLNFRKWPFKGGFALAAGLETAISWIENFRFSSSDLAYLASRTNLNGTPLFEEDFLTFLSKFNFSCDIDAMPEGTVVFPHEPIVRVQGPIWQAQLLESPLLNILNFQTLIATKAARICSAAYPDAVIEFGMRRAQGIDGAISASRASFIGGCEATSNVIAGKLYQIPIYGTHSHSWIMAFDEEETAFRAFAEISPKGCMMLIDTYDSIAGVKRAIKVANGLKPKGFELTGVRLDSGDLSALSIAIRKILDQEGFGYTKIMASNELDEYLIRDLKQQGAKITLWGVGTHLVTAKDQPALDGVYKLSAMEDDQQKWHYKLKLSETMAKMTNPGILQVRRCFDGTHYQCDVIYDELLGLSNPCQAMSCYNPNEEIKCFLSKSKDLLIPIFRKGKLVYKTPSLKEIQDYAKQEQDRLLPAIRRFINPQIYFTGLEMHLHQAKQDLIKRMKAHG